ncbi:MAG: hypothetical protein WBO22_13280 [Shewanella indica]|uniref:hypothetical protein n=1 Tax=Shewanella indica TaxID=768528 RepID=UPI003C75CF13
MLQQFSQLRLEQRLLTGVTEVAVALQILDIIEQSFIVDQVFADLFQLGFTKSSEPDIQQA